MKRIPKQPNTKLNINKSVIGESIENMVEKLMQGEGENAIEDRDLVYNSDESMIVNPITNIRSDKMELMLEEKIGKYVHDHRNINTEDKETDKIITNTETENTETE